MNQENGNVKIGADLNPDAQAAAPGGPDRSNRLRLWVNWVLALLTVVGAASVMVFSLAAVMSTAACSDKQCPNLGPSGISFNVLFYGAPVVALMEVPNESISAYGVVDAEPVSHAGGQNRLFRIRNMVEKPSAKDAPSNLAIIGRYVLTPEVFKSLDAVEPGSGGEIQLTDGLKHLLRSRPIYGYRFEGTRYDAGDKLGFLKATVEFALKRYDLGEAFRAYLKTLTL